MLIPKLLGAVACRASPKDFGVLTPVPGSVAWFWNRVTGTQEERHVHKKTRSGGDVSVPQGTPKIVPKRPPLGVEHTCPGPEQILLPADTLTAKCLDHPGGGASLWQSWGISTVRQLHFGKIVLMLLKWQQQQSQGFSYYLLFSYAKTFHRKPHISSIFYTSPTL